ncbi:RNA recognition motif domain-containing protein, partial [Pseudomonas syringae]|uniref:RNA recognition motif domain-containing protein n=1 Tax=Pseudomonas syringae TaxID=317 RepID=UPI0034D96993
MHPELKEMELFSLFNSFGKINSVRIMKNTYTGESRLFGFITFGKVEDARNAQEKLNNYEFLLREIRVYFKKNLKQANQ